jgi:hypothetical protein
MPKLLNKDLQISSRFRTDLAYVVGCQFGPMLLQVGGTVEEAWEEYHARFCDPVPAEEQTEDMFERDDIAFIDGVGPVWVDEYFWVREFHGKDAISRAGKLFRNFHYL